MEAIISVHLYLNKEDMSALDQAVRISGMSRSSIIKDALHMWLSRQEKRNWRDVLDGGLDQKADESYSKEHPEPELVEISSP